MQAQPNIIPVAYREPFAFGRAPWREVRPEGQSILEIVRSVPNLPKQFMARGIVCINGEEVPRALWSYVRPKTTSQVLPISVTLHFALQSPGGGGGGRSSTKSIVGLVAAIALVAVATFITAGGFGVAGGIFGGAFLFGQGSASAYILAGAISIAGSLAISALTAPPTTNPNTGPSSDVNSDNKEAAGAQGNVLAKGGSIPRVIGTRKVFPAVVSPPFVQQISEQDEKVSIIFGLNGPHDIDDLSVDGVDVTSATDITTEVMNGESSDGALSLVTRQGKINAPGIQLTQHVADSSDTWLLNGSYTTDIPQWHRFVTAESPDEIYIQLLLPGGMFFTSFPTANVAVPFRMRARVFGTSTWINFPEFHLSANNQKQTRRQIRLRWGVSDTGTQPLQLQNAWFYLHRAPPAQSASPATPTAWVADSHFDDGSGNDYVYAGNEASTRVKNYNVSANWQLDFIMAGLAQGKYEIEIKRGVAYAPSQFSPNTYVYNGAVRDFFWASTVGIHENLPAAQQGVSSTCILNRCVSIWNQHPIDDGQGKFALIALTAVNRNIQRVSCTAGGRVYQWNGANWTSTYSVSSNPAAHYRDVLLGTQNHDPLDATLVDDDTLADWFNQCASNTWECDAIVDDMRTQDVLDLLASCGYARPYQSDQYGVIIDNDKTGDPVQQVFSRINTSNMQFTKAFAKAPAGLVINFPNIDTDYEQDQIVVLQSDPTVGTTGLYETITYDGLVDSAKVAIRGQFDLDQANLRSTFYSFDCDIEAIVCRRGDLVAIQHDVLDDRAGDAHIKTVLTSGGNITGLVLDSKIPQLTASVGLAIRRSGGTITTHQIVPTLGYSENVTFTTPIPIPPGNTIVGYDDTDDEYGCLVVSGDLSAEYKRMLVHSITTTKDLKCTVTLVDEAPSLIRV